MGILPADRCRLNLAAPLPELPGWFDRVQVEQALINLLKNAHEAGGPGTAVELAIARNGGNQLLEVRGGGLNVTLELPWSRAAADATLGA